MGDIKLFASEYRLASIVWENEPILSGELVRICSEQLGWKKSTTYTVLKKLCNRSILKNENAVVTSVVKKAQVLKNESHTIVEKTFDGSLPRFIAAFLQGREITEKEADEIRRMIDESRGE